MFLLLLLFFGKEMRNLEKPIKITRLVQVQTDKLPFLGDQEGTTPVPGNLCMQRWDVHTIVVQNPMRGFLLN